LLPIFRGDNRHYLNLSTTCINSRSRKETCCFGIELLQLKNIDLYSVPDLCVKILTCEAHFTRRVTASRTTKWIHEANKERLFHQTSHS